MTMTDPAGVSLEARFGLTLDAVNGLSARMDRLARRLNAPPMQPVRRQFSTSTVIPAGGFSVANLFGPDQGHFWYVRRIVIGGLATTTVAAGRCDVFTSAADLRQQPSLAAIGLGGWSDQAAALPFVNRYSNGEFVVPAAEDLFFVFSGATVGQEYVAVAYIWDYQEAALTQTVDL
jgi:hypothetical protein